MKKIFLITTMLSVMATIAVSQETETTPGRDLAETVFGSIEEHPNGIIDSGEFVNFEDTIFVSMDSDENLSLDFEEFTVFDFGFIQFADEANQKRAYETAQRIHFAFWDRDGDGTIGRREYHQSMIADFRRADLDGDALLTRDEFLSGYVVNIAYRAAITGQ
ncbi:signal transduction protein [Yoonia sp. GPGPB17]|uniref:signal transduction protein n=1 Tax=Yoonia sp. GPGPB17 TaxID=3026147 RepID=UPI0030BC205F